MQAVQNKPRPGESILRIDLIGSNICLTKFMKLTHIEISPYSNNLLIITANIVNIAPIAKTPTNSDGRTLTVS